ncbi:hypothetical protein ACIPY3_19600 [Paenarthrobacter sp. NPDC089714]|uniref:hypothetical protein n=1 Tax=Paenarthrobacter sp. NPDC089714 TaxID=3364377 RepID=UPI0038209FBB
MRLRSWGFGVAGLAVLAAAAVPAGASVTPDGPPDAPPSGWLEVDGGPAGQVHQLTPGGTAHWAVDVKVQGEPASALEVWLEPGSVAAEEQMLRDHLSVELQACGQPWVDGACAGGLQELLEPTALADAEGARVQLEEPGPAGSPGTYVLVTASLANDAPQEIQGKKTRLVLGVHGAGDDLGGAGSGGEDGPPGGAGSGGDGSGGDSANHPAEPGQGTQAPPSGFLSETGTKLAGFALLGVLAVGAGFALSGLRGGTGFRGGAGLRGRAGFRGGRA